MEPDGESAVFAVQIGCRPAQTNIGFFVVFSALARLEAGRFGHTSYRHKP